MIAGCVEGKLIALEACINDLDGYITRYHSSFGTISYLKLQNHSHTSNYTANVLSFSQLQPFEETPRSPVPSPLNRNPSPLQPPSPGTLLVTMPMPSEDSTFTNLVIIPMDVHPLVLIVRIDASPPWLLIAPLSLPSHHTLDCNPPGKNTSWC